ncbi:MAG: hypothetical protein EA370_08195 [Wenzhouxiangella sp.]|nr:MAG: hypothetical protein EA370_08195 [Wenzhouxiangella sp.]
MSTSSRPDRAGDIEPLDARRKERLRAQLLSSVGGEMAVARGEAARWRRILPGVECRLLNVDRESGIQTALWRMAPGARIPAHPHACDEECYIFDGSLVHRGERYTAGDYMLAPAGSRHGSITSPDGVLMLIRGERLTLRDRFLLRAALAMGR